MKDIQNWLIVVFMGGIAIKMVCEYIKDLKKPSNDEVRDVVKLEGKMNELEGRQNRIESLIDKKVDNAVWLERSSKIESFSRQHNTELTAVRQELNKLNNIIAGMKRI